MSELLEYLLDTMNETPGTTERKADEAEFEGVDLTEGPYRSISDNIAFNKYNIQHKKKIDDVVNNNHDRSIILELKEKISKLNEEYKSTIREQIKSVDQFKKIEELFISAGYLGYNKIIDELKEYLQRSISSMHVQEFNTIFSVNIPNHYDLLEQNLYIVNWYCLSSNAGAVPIIEKNIDKVIWKELSKNHGAIKLFKKHMNKLDIENLTKFNIKAVDLLEEYSDLYNDYFINLCNFGGRTEYKMSSIPPIHDIKNSDVGKDPRLLKMYMDSISSNDYDYGKEKIEVFNNLKIFKSITLKLVNKPSNPCG